MSSTTDCCARSCRTARYQPVEPRHSWNTNHIVSNLMTFHLQRHSDHHANPMRPYQSLRDFDDIPRLPNGYTGHVRVGSDPAALVPGDGPQSAGLGRG